MKKESILKREGAGKGRTRLGTPTALKITGSVFAVGKGHKWLEEEQSACFYFLVFPVEWLWEKKKFYGPRWGEKGWWRGQGPNRITRRLRKRRNGGTGGS